MEESKILVSKNIMTWQTKKLGEVCEIVNGGTPKTNIKSYWDGDILWITPKDMGKMDNIYVARTDRMISDAGLKNSSAKIIPQNSVILSTRAPIGHLAINITEITTNQGCKGLVPHHDLYTKYLYYFLEFSVELLNSLGSGTTFKEISGSTLKDVWIPIPTLAEQKRIVKKLDEVFLGLGEVREKAERNLKNAKELFESYLQGVFENLGEDWEEKNLGDIANFRNGMNFTKTSKGQTIKIVGVRDFQKSFFVPFTTLESVTIDGSLNETDLLREGDILTVRSNGNPELIGRTLLAEKVDGDVSHSGFTIRIRIEDKNVYPVYLCHYLKSKKARELLVKSGTGTNIKSLNQGALTALVIPLPKIAEQNAIVKKLDALSAQTKELEAIFRKKIAGVDELKKSVLQKAFAGEL